MRRHDKSLVSHSQVDFSLTDSTSQKVDNLPDVVDTTLVSSVRFDKFGAFGYDLSASVMPEPKLDAMLADVASKLPTIDLDMSDVSFVDYSSQRLFADLMKAVYFTWPPPAMMTKFV